MEQSVRLIMKFKIYRPEQDLPETGIQSALRNVTGALANTAEHATNLLGTAAQTIANPLAVNPVSLYSGQQQPQNPIKQDIAKALPQDYLQPRNQNEESFQEYASLVPLHLLGGGSISSIPSFLTRTFLGKKAGEAVESAGGGKLGNIAAQIAVPGLLEGLNIKNIKSYFDPYKQDVYKDLPSIAGKSKINAADLEKKLDYAWSESKGRKGESSIRKSIQLIQDEIKDGHIDVNRLQPLKKKLNALVYEDGRKILKPVLSETFSLIDKNPEYSQALKKADKLHQTLENLENGESFISELKNVKGYKTKVGLIGKGMRLLYKAPTTQSISLLSKLGSAYPKETLQYATKSLEAASKKQAPAFFSNMAKLEQLINKVDDEQPQFKIYRKV